MWRDQVVRLPLNLEAKALGFSEEGCQVEDQGTDFRIGNRYHDAAEMLSVMGELAERAVFMEQSELLSHLR